MRRFLAVVLLAALSTIGLVPAAIAEPGPPGSQVPSWVQVSAGDNHACGVKEDHTLWCWGSQDSVGKLGTGDGIDHSSPAQVAPQIAWASVTAGQWHTCAITTAQRLYCWGANWYGALGVGTTTDHLTPHIVGRGLWLNVTATNGNGAYGTCGVTTAQRLYCWGENFHGQIGDGTQTHRLVPTQILGPTWKQAGGGSAHTCAIRGTGTLWCWGYRFSNEIGDGGGANPLVQAVPKKVGSISEWSQLDVDHQHSCALRTSGTMYCWGRNRDDTGSIPVFGPGTGSDGFLTRMAQPYECGALNCVAKSWTGLGVGGFHQCGLAQGGGLWCWGVDDKGQLGNGAGGATASPQRIGTVSWAQVSGGYEFTCAISGAGHLSCWGEGSDGQLGNGLLGDRTSPTLVS